MAKGIWANGLQLASAPPVGWAMQTQIGPGIVARPLDYSPLLQDRGRGRGASGSTGTTKKETDYEFGGRTITRYSNEQTAKYIDAQLESVTSTYTSKIFDASHNNDTKEVERLTKEYNDIVNQLHSDKDRVKLSNLKEVTTYKVQHDKQVDEIAKRNIGNYSAIRAGAFGKDAADIFDDGGLYVSDGRGNILNYDQATNVSDNAPLLSNGMPTPFQGSDTDIESAQTTRNTLRAFANQAGSIENMKTLVARMDQEGVPIASSSDATYAQLMAETTGNPFSTLSVTSNVNMLAEFMNNAWDTMSDGEKKYVFSRLGEGYTVFKDPKTGEKFNVRTNRVQARIDEIQDKIHNNSELSEEEIEALREEGIGLTEAIIGSAKLKAMEMAKGVTNGLTSRSMSVTTDAPSWMSKSQEERQRGATPIQKDIESGVTSTQNIYGDSYKYNEEVGFKNYKGTTEFDVTEQNSLMPKLFGNAHKQFINADNTYNYKLGNIASTTIMAGGVVSTKEKFVSLANDLNVVRFISKGVKIPEFEDTTGFIGENGELTTTMKFYERDIEGKILKEEDGTDKVLIPTVGYVGMIVEGDADSKILAPDGNGKLALMTLEKIYKNNDRGADGSKATKSSYQMHPSTKGKYRFVVYAKMADTSTKTVYNNEASVDQANAMAIKKSAAEKSLQTQAEIQLKNWQERKKEVERLRADIELDSDEDAFVQPRSDGSPAIVIKYELERDNSGNIMMNDGTYKSVPGQGERVYEEMIKNGLIADVIDINSVSIEGRQLNYPASIDLILYNRSLPNNLKKEIFEAYAKKFVEIGEKTSKKSIYGLSPQQIKAYFDIRKILGYN